MSIIARLSAIPIMSFRFIKRIIGLGHMNCDFTTLYCQHPLRGADSCLETYTIPLAHVDHTFVGPAAHCPWRESLVRPLALPWCPGYATVLLRCCSIGTP